MSTLQTFLLVFQVVVSVVLIGFILIQQGKGADAGAAFGGGASGTVFGSQGGGNFFTRATAVLAILFLGNSLLLGYLAAHSSTEPSSLLENETSIMSDVVPQSVEESIEIPATDTADNLEESAPMEPTQEMQAEEMQSENDEAPLVPQQ